jgi:hypothetical protein
VSLIKLGKTTQKMIGSLRAAFKVMSYKFDLCLTVHIQCRQFNKIKTNWMQQNNSEDLEDQ